MHVNKKFTSLKVQKFKSAKARKHKVLKPLFFLYKTMNYYFETIEFYKFRKLFEIRNRSPGRSGNPFERKPIFF